MDQLIDIVKKVGVARAWASVAVLLIVIIFSVFIGLRYSGPELVLLFGDLDRSSSQQIQIELSKRKVSFDVREDGKQIYVPRQHLEDLRVSLAEVGLTGALAGYEIFDKGSAIGTSNFEQKLNAVRAMEGELARTISSMKGVAGARVHIVLPQRDLFSRTETRSSASIVLKMKSTKRLEASQVNAIQHIVSSSIPKLKISDISIADDQGALLARGGLSEEGGDTASVIEQRIKEEDRLRSHIEGLLVRTLGFGKARVEVRIEVNQSRVEINNETFDPDSTTLRSNETIEESSASNAGPSDVVTVGQNLPNNQPNSTDTASSSENASRIEERRNFEISRQVQTTVVHPGKIERISVAVLVDGEYQTDNDGNNIYVERSLDEINKIESLVKSAIGYTEQRGDLVEIVNMQFAALPGDFIEDSPIYLGIFTNDDIRDFLELAVLLLVGFLILIIVVRPIVQRMFDTPDTQIAASVGKGMVRLPDGRMVYIDPETGEQQELPVASGGKRAPGEGFQQEETKPLDEILTGNLDSKVQANAIKKIGDIINKHPEEAVQILRSWMYTDSY